MRIAPAWLRCVDCGRVITITETNPDSPALNRFIGKCNCGEADITNTIKEMSVQVEVK